MRTGGGPGGRSTSLPRPVSRSISTLYLNSSAASALRSRSAARRSSAVHGAEPAAEREGRLEGDVARAEIIPPGASGKTDGEPEVEPEGAGAEVEDGVAEPEVHVFEAVHRARIRRIADAVRDREDRLQAV